MISNLLRNLSMHFGTPFKVVNEPIERVVQQVHTILGIDVNDPRSTWSGVTFRLSRIPLHEDWSGNPVHLILFTFILSVTGATIWRNKELLAYLWSVGGAFLLFCAYLKWQPWHSRLHLPLFVLFCPLCAVLLDGLAKPKLVKFSVNLLLAAALPFVFLNISRPILFPANIFNISRKDLYFSNRPYLRNSYIEAVNFISGQNCSQIGLYIGGEDWEYPFWMLLEEKFGKSVRLEHIGVGNYSTPKAHIAPFDAFCPCAIISTRPEAGNEITFHAGIFEKKFSSGTVSVFVQR